MPETNPSRRQLGVIVLKSITLGETLTEDEQAQLDALSERDRHRLKCEERAQAERRCLAFARLAARKDGTATIAAPVTADRVRRGPRARGAGRPRGRAVARASSRGGDSGDDGSGSSAGDGDPPRDLLADTKDYLSRLGPHGAERSWLVDQVAYLGHEPEIVGAALALLTSEGKAGRSVDEDGTDVVWRRS